jgi:glycosyltransferase involved in cell wall biosynthesis
MRPPHIVVVNQNAPLEMDLRPRREAETLAAAGYEVTLVGGCLSPHDVREVTSRDVRLELFRQPEGGRGVGGQVREQSQAMALSMRALRRASRRSPVSVVHAGNPPDNLFLAGQALRLAQRGAARFVFDQHDAAPVLLAEKFPHTPLTRPLMTTARAIERWSFALASLVVFANAEYRSRAIREGLLRGDSEVVPNGWSLPEVLPDLAWRDGVEHLVAYVGTIGEQDNVDHLVDAVAAIRSARRLRVAVAGSGSALDSVRRRARDLGVDQSFEWLGFVGDRDRIAALVRAADVCVAPELDSEFNRLATFVKVIEYMSAGAATVAHRLPQTETLAGDTVAYPRDMTAQGLAETIGELLESPARRRALGDAARRRFEDRVSWEQNGAHRLVEAYERLFATDGDPLSRRRNKRGGFHDLPDDGPQVASSRKVPGEPAWLSGEG